MVIAQRFRLSARGDSRRHLAVHRLVRDHAAIAGGAAAVCVALVALLAPWVAPFDPYVTRTEIRLAPVGTPGHVMGTDGLGRDLLSRVVWGARSSLTAGVVPVTLALSVGSMLGTVAGFYGGRVDAVIMRVLDVAFAFPAILLAIAIVAILGPGLHHAILALLIVSIPSFARLARSRVLVAIRQEYVEAARASGASDARILVRHIMPNASPLLIVYATLETGRMLVFAAGLSFVGLGVQPPTPEWGAMLSEGRSVLNIAPHVATLPGLMLFLVSLSLNLLGDGLRDALDPRTRL